MSTTTTDPRNVMRPIVGIENRTAQEVFDIMCDRFNRALTASGLSIVPVVSGVGELVRWSRSLASQTQHKRSQDDVDDALNRCASTLESLAARAEAAEAANAELRAALEPFADISDLVDSETEGLSDTDEFSLLFHDYLLASWALSVFRRVASLLRKEVRATHRHKKRGSEYVLLGIGRMQAENWYLPGAMEAGPSVDMREVAIYRSVDDGSLWVRPREEFEDGRFEALSPAPAVDEEGEGR